MLAIRLMQQQGIEVHAVHLQTPFTRTHAQAVAAAESLGVRLTVVYSGDAYLRLLEDPRHGYGKGANPCVDCRIYLLTKAREQMEATGARFLISGEVAGQRVTCQKRQQLSAVAHHAGVKDLLLRPLSAQLLPQTLAEREGWVDREQLYGFTGNGRKPQLKLAKELGVQPPPPLTSCCALMHPAVAQNVFDLIDAPGVARGWEYALLNVGRHFRFSPQQKVVVARDAGDGKRLVQIFNLPEVTPAALLQPENFRGPIALLTGDASDEAIAFARGLVLQFARNAGEDARLSVTRRS